MNNSFSMTMYTFEKINQIRKNDLPFFVRMTFLESLK